jgi:hypothetical protein
MQVMRPAQILRLEALSVINVHSSKRHWQTIVQRFSPSTSNSFLHCSGSLTSSEAVCLCPSSPPLESWSTEIDSMSQYSYFSAGGEACISAGCSPCYTDGVSIPKSGLGEFNRSSHSLETRPAPSWRWKGSPRLPNRCCFPSRTRRSESSRPPPQIFPGGSALPGGLVRPWVRL